MTPMPHHTITLDFFIIPHLPSLSFIISQETNNIPKCYYAYIFNISNFLIKKTKRFRLVFKILDLFNDKEMKLDNEIF